jgi:hypothetical protein
MSVKDGSAWSGPDLTVGPATLTSVAEATAVQFGAGPVLGSLLRSERKAEITAEERRAAFRLQLPAGRAWVETAHGGRSFIQDISARGACLLVRPSDRLPAATYLPATVRLADEASFPIGLRVVRSAAAESGKGIRLGVCFSELPVNAMQVLSRFIVGEYVQQEFDLLRLLRTPGMVRHQDRDSIIKLICGAALRDQQKIRVFRDGKLLPIQVEMISLRSHPGGDAIHGRIVGEADCLGSPSDLRFMLPARSSVQLFETPILRSGSDEILLSLPHEVVQTGFRDSLRAPATSEAACASISFQHPHLPDRRVVKRVVDVAARGMAIDMHVMSDLLFPQDRLTDVVLTLPDGAFLETSGVIRGMHRLDLSVVRCGIELNEFPSSGQRGRWHDFVFSRIHPRIHATADTDLQGVWDVYRTSTYLERWISTDLQPAVERSFKRSWTDLEPSDGRLLILRQNRRAVGTIAANRIYPRTWLMHGLAVDRAQRQEASREHFLDITRELYSGITYTLRHLAQCQYFLSYFENGKSWNQNLYGDFAKRYGSKRHQLYDAGYVLHRRTQHDPQTGAENLWAGPASHADRLIVARVATATLSPTLVDAFSLRARELDLGSPLPSARHLELQCRREILVVREDGELRLAAVCETSPDYLSIFGLMNVCWTIPLSGGQTSSGAVSALMGAVVRHYRAHGVPEFLLFEESNERLPLLQALGFVNPSAAIRWLAAVEVLPAWLAYLEEQLGMSRKPVFDGEDPRAAE